MNGSSTNEGSGVGLALISPQGEEIKLVVWLHFKAFNNEAEYEALLIGLPTAQNVGVAWVLMHLDSQLVTQQVQGTFEIKDEKLRKYGEPIELMKENFVEVVLKQIP